MTDELIFDALPQAEPEGEDALNLANYAQRAYLEYALSVVKGRALPDVCDGQKPVQRRILYAMSRMGLGFGGANGNVGAKPVKCARVVGGAGFHPALPLDRRPGQLWQPGWRRRRRHALHRGAPCQNHQPVAR